MPNHSHLFFSSEQEQPVLTSDMPGLRALASQIPGILWQSNEQDVARPSILFSLDVDKPEPDSHLLLER